MIYDDLLAVPYKENGRDMSGMDCYGFAIECFSRVGKKLKDILAKPDGDLEEYINNLNVKIIPEPRTNCGVQFHGSMGLHIGIMLYNREVLHMTKWGVKITPLICLNEPRFFEVTDER